MRTSKRAFDSSLIANPDVADPYTSSCCKCFPRDLHILLQDPGAICLGLAFLVFSPKDVLLPVLTNTVS